jgi:non-ribosomal peptide synthetase component F
LIDCLEPQPYYYEAKGFSLCDQTEVMALSGASGPLSSPQTPVDSILTKLQSLPPDKVVLQKCGGVGMTASELLNASLGLATALDTRLGKHSRVPLALLMERDVGLVVTVLGSWISGRVVAPLSWDWPVERLASALGQFGTGEGRGVVLVPEKRELRAEALPCEVVDSTELLHQAKSVEYAPMGGGIGPGEMLYYTFTSGSTGRPKAVCTEAAGLMNLWCNYSRVFGLDDSSRVYQVVNPAFDIFFADMLSAFMAGGMLVLAGGRLPSLREIGEYGITHAHIMPAYLARMMGPEELSVLSGIKVGGAGWGARWTGKVVLSASNSVERQYQRSGYAWRSRLASGPSSSSGSPSTPSTPPVDSWEETCLVRS